MIKCRHGERGQATTETMLLTWILILFIAAAYQLFLVNEQLFRSITAAHFEMFSKVENCWEEGERCEYDFDQDGRVIWSPNHRVPEVRIPTVGLFAHHGLTTDLRVRGTYFPPDPMEGCPVPCKRTRMAGGTYMSPWDALGVIPGVFGDPNYYMSLINNALAGLLSLF